MKTKRKEKLNIVVGITGGIAAYKAAIFIRSLIKNGHSVVSIATENAYKFIGEWTLKTITGNEVVDDVFMENSTEATRHISLAHWCDLMVVTPATANFVAKAANGIADDALTTFNLSFSGKKIIAPAMNTEMLNSPQVQNNLKMLESYGYSIIEPQAGTLACGDVGKGRLADTDDIVFEVEKSTYPQDLEGKNILINGGRTKEMIDPVRYISNKSSGYMAKMLCEMAALRGGNVTYIQGDTDVEAPKGVKTIIKVDSADEMYENCMKHTTDYDIAILSAAVADFKAAQYSPKKIKKVEGEDETTTLELSKNRDILLSMGQNKPKDATLVGFALESNSGIKNTTKKLKDKGADFMILNSLEHSEAFGDTNNNYWIFDSSGTCSEIPNANKKVFAEQLFTRIAHTIK